VTQPTLRCPGCGGFAPVPPDPTVLAVPCPYCGHDLILPDQPARQAALRQRQEADARRAADAEARRDREATRRMAARWKIIGGVVVGLAVAGPIAYVVVRAWREAERDVERARAAQAAADQRIAQAGRPHLDELISAAQSGRCGRVFIDPQLGDRTLELRFTVGTRRCVRIVATTAVDAATISLALTGADGQPAAAPPPARDLDFEYCPRTGAGTHQATLTSTGPLSAAAIECERALPTDPDGVGATRVAEILEARRAAGCKQILAAAQTHVGEQTLTATLNRGTCVQLVAATGMPDNDLTVSLSTPLGRPVPAPPPGREVILSYCAEPGGDHTGRITPAVGGPFTSAALVCPRRAMPAAEAPR